MNEKIRQQYSFVRQTRFFPLKQNPPCMLAANVTITVGPHSCLEDFYIVQPAIIRLQQHCYCTNYEPAPRYRFTP